MSSTGESSGRTIEYVFVSLQCLWYVVLCAVGNLYLLRRVRDLRSGIGMPFESIDHRITFRSPISDSMCWFLAFLQLYSTLRVSTRVAVLLEEIHGALSGVNSVSRRHTVDIIELPSTHFMMLTFVVVIVTLTQWLLLQIVVETGVNMHVRRSKIVRWSNFVALIVSISMTVFGLLIISMGSMRVLEGWSAGWSFVFALGFVVISGGFYCLPQRMHGQLKRRIFRVSALCGMTLIVRFVLILPNTQDGLGRDGQRRLDDVVFFFDLIPSSLCLWVLNARFRNDH